MSRERPWWWVRQPEDSDEELGEPGPGKRLVVTLRDRMGDAVEWTWVSDETLPDWHERFWV